MERSKFLKILAAGAVCGSVPILPGCAASLPYLQTTLKNHQLIVKRTKFKGRAAFLENPQTKKPIYLHRFPDGTFAAVLTRCTHKGCQVNATPDHLVCPCHGSEFTYRGEVINGPADKPLFQFNVTTDAEHIYIELPNHLKP